MSDKVIRWNVLKDVSWWHWVLTIPLLAAHLAGVPWAIVAAMVLCAAAGSYFYLRLKQLRPYPVQVRIAYLGLLALGTVPGMHWLYWIPLVGTTVMVTTGYCPLIRTLSLAGWNRTEPFQWSLVWQAFFREPCAGGLLQWTTPTSLSTTSSCSLPVQHSALTCSAPLDALSEKEISHVATH
jgi:hypothetical protein